ncbi:MAG TPA: hypothetical protein VLT32_05675 [Candidatus Sulfomarinibacteraceae bacterium]|nr:hypothetical protein [Candidatus Sulfomarinibacteraceae bacterium]
MKPANLVLGVLTVMTIATAPAAAADPPGREFTGTAVVDGPQGTRSMPLTLVVNRFSPVSEVQELGSLLAKGGQGTLLSALRGRADGEIRLGALNVPVALVSVEETSDGYRYLFLSPRRIQFNETQLGEESLDYPFGIAVFEVDGFSGLGEGSLHVAARLSIDADGHIEIDDYDGRDGHFRDLRQVR